MTSSAPILDPVQQRFVSAILQGKSQAEAYKLAGYPGADKLPNEVANQRGHNVARGTAVRCALARAREGIEARVELRVEDLVARLEQAYHVALSSDPPQANAAVSATMGIAKLLGLVIDRSELTVMKDKPSLFPTKILELTEEEWRQQFASRPEK